MRSHKLLPHSVNVNNRKLQENRKCHLAAQLPLLQCNGIKSNHTPQSDLNSCTCTKRLRKRGLHVGQVSMTRCGEQKGSRARVCCLELCLRVSAGM